MVQRVFDIVYREVRGLHQAAYILAIFTFGSQLLALIRDRLLAHQFGAGIELDLYYTAFRIPDFLYVLFASTLSVYVLIPFIAGRMEGKGERARHLLSQIFTLFLGLYALVAFLAIIAAPDVVRYFFPGFVEHTDILIPLIRLLLLQPLLLGISSLLGVITQIEHRFVLYAISPLIYNLGIILGVVVLYPIFGIEGLAFGVVLGALGHVCIQLPFILKSPLRPRLTLRFDPTDMVAVFRTSLTRAVTLSLHQLVLIGLIGFASIMTVGSVSVFQFAFNLQSVPLAIIGMSYSVAAFPLLAKLYAEKKHELFSENITTALRHIFFWSLPAITLFIVIRAQFVRVVLGSGEFDWSDTRLTAAVLAVFVVSLVSQGMHLLLVRALYAVGNTRLPFYVTLGSSTLALLFGFYFYSLFVEHGFVYRYFESLMRLDGVPGVEVLALPMGYSLALIIHSIVLLVVARKALYVRLRPLVRSFYTSAVAAFFGGYVAYATLSYFGTSYEADTLMTVLSEGFVAGLGGLGGVILAHYAVGSRELSEIGSALKKRFTKVDVLVPQDEDTLAV
ncbi:MAG TPA: lipid II flippase MurJ [Candidatus Paceibacterota bacterium]|nr:lipid II flippase MurJ [Candidatus Paceibacterota bacterium]